MTLCPETVNSVCQEQQNYAGRHILIDACKYMAVVLCLAYIVCLLFGSNHGSHGQDGDKGGKKEQEKGKARGGNNANKGREKCIPDIVQR